MGAVFLHQLHDNLRSLRFQVSVAVLLLFFVSNGLIYAMKIDRLDQEDRMIDAAQEERYSRAETVGDAADDWFQIINRATGTEFIAEAGFNWFPAALWVTPRYGNTIGYNQLRSTNNWMRRFEVLDWTLIVRYVLSFLCVVLAYNAISGDLERGTLRLVLANPLSRGSFLVGKFLAHLLTLGAALLVGSLVSLVILVVGGFVEPGARLWGGVAAFYVAALFFAALFLLLGMGVSVLARNSASALVFLVTAWTVLIVVIPQASYLLATQSVQDPGRFWDEMNDLERETWDRLRREGVIPRDPELAQADNYTVERAFLQRAQDLDEELNQMMAAAEGQRQDQFRYAMGVNLLSPGFAFQYTVEALLGAGLQHVQHFGRLGARYREHLRQFLRARDANDPASPHLYFLPDFMSAEPLDAAHIPRFEPELVPLDTRVDNAVLPAVVLVLETVLAFLFALWAFNRSELTSAE